MNELSFGYHGNGKRVAISQSNYIPWKGYFDLISSVDEFIFYDDMQYTRRDWRNRNQIKTPNGPIWLTIPIESKGKYHQTIRETQISPTDWQSDHWKSIQLNYKRAAYFDEVSMLLAPLYTSERFRFLSDLNYRFIDVICGYLGIETRLKSSADYSLVDGKSERLADLCVQCNASIYISGPSAKSYLDKNVFDKLNVSVEWFEYLEYPEYKQLWGDYIHNVSIIDLLFNCGQTSGRYMRCLN